MEDTTPEQNRIQNNTLNEGVMTYTSNEDNEIHPTAIIGKDVVMGKGNKIGAYCIITGDTKIGNNNVFESFCVIGSEPEHKAYFGKPNKGVFIGCDNVIREYVTINAGCERTTRLTNNCIMLRGSHLGHDAIVEKNVTISCNVLVGGHSIIGSGANLGLGAILHQFSKIGCYSMIGMGTIVTKKSNIQCFGTYVGNPAKYIKENDYQKLKFSSIEVNLIRESWDIFITHFKE
jgi:UDP-N-acetylglucosamine acyltransferase